MRSLPLQPSPTSAKNRFSAGFTLVELLVVISIIGLLSAVAIVNSRSSSANAKIAAGMHFDSSLRNSLGDELAGEWTFDAGTANDVSGYGKNGTFSGTTTAVAGYNGRGAIYFGPGTMTTPVDIQPTAMPSVTFSAWIKPNPVAGSQTVMGDDDGGYDRAVECERAGDGYFNVFTGSGTWKPATCDSDVWQHIAVTYTPTNIYFYKNGVKYTSNIVPTNGGTVYNFIVGGHPAGGERFYGVIDDVRVYSAAP